MRRERMMPCSFGRRVKVARPRLRFRSVGAAIVLPFHPGWPRTDPVSEFLYGVVILMAVLAFCFLFGGVLTFREDLHSEEAGMGAWTIIDSFCFGLFSSVRYVVLHWSTNRDGRILLYNAGAFFIATAVLVFVRSLF
jgi:uncharacterized membrane protein HdeD (DUF308 family)